MDRIIEIKTKFDCLVKFTNGVAIVVGDHKWEPIMVGLVKYTYRDRAPIEIDMVEAAKVAGSILDRHSFWAS